MEKPVAGVEPARITVVVPVLNAMRYLPRTAPTLIRAAERAGNARIVFVDNGSTDGSLDYVRSLPTEFACSLSAVGATIAAMRNLGARCGDSDYVGFLDSDCGIPEHYFRDAIDVLRQTGAGATGCEVELPEAAGWIERTLHDLHFIGRERDVVYINSANFFMSRSAFDAVGGFREDLRTGEDADIGQRLVVAGYRLWESPRVKAIHYGNPQSIGEYYRRVVWHGLGMFATVTRHRIDRPTAMLGIHALLTGLALALVLGTQSTGGVRFVLPLLLTLSVPAITVIFRIGQTRRLPNAPNALLLYWLYYLARAHAAILILSGRAKSYRK